MKTIEQVREETSHTVVTIDDFFTWVSLNCINSSQGDGYLHNGEDETDINLWNIEEISEVLGCFKTFEDFAEAYPYVIWYPSEEYLAHKEERDKAMRAIYKPFIGDEDNENNH